MNIDLNGLMTSLASTVMQVGLKLLGALVIWVVGGMIISFALKLLTNALGRQKMDTTIVGYLRTSVSVLLRIGLLLAVLGFLGVETSSFAALIAAAGVAIGMAWSGLLSNFAAGVFLVILRPFKVGDFITAGGITGTVESLGLFATTIDTPDGVRTMVGNSKVFADTIQNFTANPHRRVDLTAQLPHGVDPQAAIALLRDGMRRIPNVATAPAPDCEILTFNAAGPVLAVRPYTHNDHYWQVYFDTNNMIAKTFAAARYPVPAERRVVVTTNATPAVA